MAQFNSDNSGHIQALTTLAHFMFHRVICCQRWWYTFMLKHLGHCFMSFISKSITNTEGHPPCRQTLVLFFLLFGILCKNWILGISSHFLIPAGLFLPSFLAPNFTTIVLKFFKRVTKETAMALNSFEFLLQLIC